MILGTNKHMSDKEVIKKVVEKAKKNGWETNWVLPEGDAIFSVIYNHDFAKAFFGEEWTDVLGKDVRANCPFWKVQLQIMVIMEKPLKYLEECL